MRIFGLIILLFLALGCNKVLPGTILKPDSKVLHPDESRHFKSIRQLTFGGDNAEAYWSFDDKSLVFQATNKTWGANCDQIFIRDINKSYSSSDQAKLISTGKGRTTCSYFLPGNKKVLYASTHASNDACPAPPERRSDGKYVWAIYPEFDIYIADLNGQITTRLTNQPGYDAEATVSPKGDKIVFTSLRNGDLDLYTTNLDGSEVKQITHELGYDGGAFFSPDGNELIFRASRPKTADEVATYKQLLAEGLVMPTQMELFMCNADGSNLRQITSLGGANWCPFFHPSGKKVIFGLPPRTDQGQTGASHARTSRKE